MHTPRLSIGVPVYNGARFLRATLDSILAQTYTDFELIICDNCSIDATESIAREYAAKDPRVRYFRNERNLGPAPNYNRCFQYARGELFKWSAADDCIQPTFLQKCVELLDSDPSIVCAYTKTMLIDEQGRPYRKYDHELDLDHPSPVVRFARLVFVNHRKHNAHEFWGVVRADALRKTPLKGSFPSADRILMSFWTLQGRMARVEEYLFLNREHPQRSQRAIANRDFRPGSALSRWIGGGPTPPYEWWEPGLKGRIVFPEWRWVWEYLRAVRMTRLPLQHKLGCYAVMVALYVTFLPRLARDVLIAAEQLLRRLVSFRRAAPISDTGGAASVTQARDSTQKRAA